LDHAVDSELLSGDATRIMQEHVAVESVRPETEGIHRESSLSSSRDQPEAAADSEMPADNAAPTPRKKPGRKPKQQQSTSTVKPPPTVPRNRQPTTRYGFESSDKKPPPCVVDQVEAPDMVAHEGSDGVGAKALPLAGEAMGGPLSVGNRDSSDPFIRLDQDDDLRRKVIHHMALHDEQQADRSPARDPLNPRPTAITEGFFWRDFPACERVLYDNMAQYHGTRGEGNRGEVPALVVEQVRAVANENGWVIHLTDRQLRDRVRCFYKTHLQNAGKRLLTIMKRRDSTTQAQLWHYINAVRQS
jgi:hypothetical protein